MNIINVSINQGDMLPQTGQISIQFDKVLNINTINNNTIYIVDEYNVKQNIQYNIDSPDTIVISYELQHEKTYTLTVKQKTLLEEGVLQLDGSTISSDYTVAFTTETYIQIDYSKTELVDVSDEPINLYEPSENSPKFSIDYQIEGNEITFVFSQNKTIQELQQFIEIEVEHIYGNLIPTYIFFQQIDPKTIKLIFKQMDGEDLQNNIFINIYFNSKDQILEQLFFINNINPIIISKNFLKRKLGQLISTLNENDIDVILIDSLLELQNITNKKFIPNITGLLEIKNQAEIYDGTYISVNQNQIITPTNHVISTIENNYIELFKQIQLVQQLEFVSLKINNIQKLSFEETQITYNTTQHLQLLQHYKNQLDKFLERQRYNNIVPVVAKRGIMINTQFDTLAVNKIFSRRNIYRS